MPAARTGRLEMRQGPRQPSRSERMPHSPQLSQLSGARAGAGFDAELFEQSATPERFEGTDVTVVEYPSPALRAPTAEVAVFDEALSALCAQCFSVMYAANGVGIAAPQLGKSVRLFVYNTDPGAPGALRALGERVVANPKIVEYGDATEVGVEGCLSVRAECCRGDVRRASSIKVEYQDACGRVQRKELRGFEACLFQHKFDNLHGVLHIDRLSGADRLRVQPYLDALVEEHGPGGALEPDAKVAASLQPPPASTGPPPKRSARRSAAKAGAKRAGKGTGKGAAAAKAGGGGRAARPAGFGGFGGAGAGRKGKSKRGR